MLAGVITNTQLDQLARRMHVPYFRSVFMRNADKALYVEMRAVNLDDARNPGTHWIEYKERQSRDTFR